jgi:hypothetical protein
MLLMLLFGLPLVFQVILHLNYSNHDRNTQITIDYRNSTITFNNPEVEKSFRFEEIDSIERWHGEMRKPMNEIFIFPSIYYNYTVIRSKNNEAIIFTDFVRATPQITDHKIIKKYYPLLNLIQE